MKINISIVFSTIVSAGLLLGAATKKELSDKEFSSLAQKAYVYAYPLVTSYITKQMSIATTMHINRFAHMREFPDASYHYIVRPNVDTLYSNAWLDLSQEPIILSVPDTHERYYVLQMLDAWTNVFAAPGKRTTGTKAQNFAIVGPEWKGGTPKGMQIIHAPTNMVWILGRTQTNGKKDYEFVHAIQDGYLLTPLSLWKKNKKVKGTTLNNASKSALESPSTMIDTMSAIKFYSVFAQALKENAPQKADSSFLNELAQIGIMPGMDFKVQTFTPQKIKMLEQAKKLAMQDLKKQSKKLSAPINGWNVIGSNIGRYGTDYKTRAVITLIGFGANLPEDAVYPTAFVDGDNLTLDGKNNYVLHFDKDQIPPVNAFWSVTLYDEDSFLVKNSLNRYALGDRDQLLFNDDGSLDIYIQHKSPGKAQESNWLPAPGKKFNLSMRLYWPKESVLDGSWKPAPIKKA